jgi:elongation factor 2
MAKMTERVQAIMPHPKQIRNIAICAHIDHGKTTFSDNLLSGAGMMSENLSGKARALDFAEDEKARGITIDTAAVSMVHTVEGKEYLINLLDTPGHVDFGGDVTRAMRACDGAIVLACAVEGVMPQTETVLRQALKEKVRPVLFINKADRLIKELQLTPQQMQERFIKIISEVNKRITDIVGQELGKKWQINVQEGKVGFGSAFHNWALSIPYMKKKNITFGDVIDAYNKEGDAYKELAKKAPIHEVVLDMVVEHLPNPLDAQKYRIPILWRGELESEDGKALLNCDAKGPLFFCITKVIVDKQAGEISCGRLFSGTINKGDQVYLNRQKRNTRVQQVYLFNGAKRDIVDEIPAGNFIGIAGIKAPPGETITLKESEPFEQISHIFEPVITKAIEAKKPGDLPKLIEVLQMVQKKDPTIKIEINEETGEHLMHGMGELHLEVIENRIKADGLEVKTSPPVIVYRETVNKKSQEMEGKSPNKHNRFYFTVEPLDDATYKAMKSGDIRDGRIKKKIPLEMRDKLVECGWQIRDANDIKHIYEGNMFVDNTKGVVHIGEILPLVLDEWERTMKKGPLARDPCVKMLTRFTDTKLHEDAIHRGPGQVYPAVRDAVKQAILHAHPVLFEPLQVILIEAPVEYTGGISKIVSNKRGQLLEMNQEGTMVVVKAKMPVGEMLGWSSDLRSATGGRGTSSLIDQTFQKLPGELQGKVVQKIRQRKGLTESQI